MIRLNPVYKQIIWGGTKIRDVLHKDTGTLDKVAESWEVSTHRSGESVIGGGPHAGKTLSAYFEEIGWENIGKYAVKYRQLPIMIKYIDAQQNLSVQVHPGERYARKHENDGGKNEMWYVLAAEEGAFLYLGFNRDVTKQQVRRACKDGTIESLLNKIPVHKGEVFYIPAGTVHAIGAGCLICEIQQTSNATYRLYDYGRVDESGKSRPLHLKDGLNVLNLRRTPVPTGRSVPSANRKAKNMLGTVEHISISEYNACGENTFTYPDAKFTVALILEGNGRIVGNGAREPISQGETWMFTERQFRIEGKCRVLIISY